MLRRTSLLLLILFLLASCSLVNPVINNNPLEPTLSPATATMPAAPATSTIAPAETPVPLPSPTAALTPTIVVTTTISKPEAPQFIQKKIEEPKYIVQPGTPLAVANFVQTEAGCNWMGIAGQVFSVTGEPVTNLVVDIEGKLEGQDVLFLAITGTAQLIGPGGFVIQLADHPLATEGTMFLQVFDLQGVPQSNQIPLTTYASCEQNLILLNLTAFEKKEKLYLPSIYGSRSTETP